MACCILLDISSVYCKNIIFRILAIIFVCFGFFEVFRAFFLHVLRYQFETWYSVSPIYRGRVYRGIGYIAVAWWTPFFGAQERDIFREIAVTPWTQFAGDNFSPNLLTAIAFVPGSQETIFRESSLPVLPGQCGLEHMLCVGQSR